MDNIIGYEKLQAKLQELGNVAGGKVMRSAAMTATLPALHAIQAAAPVGTRHHKTYKGRIVTPGFLKRNIRRKSFISRDRTFVKVIIGPASEAWYAQLLEFGTSKMARRPFLEPAFRASMGSVLARFEDQLTKKIDAASR